METHLTYDEKRLALKEASSKVYSERTFDQYALINTAEVESYYANILKEYNKKHPDDKLTEKDLFKYIMDVTFVDNLSIIKF